MCLGIDRYLGGGLADRHKILHNSRDSPLMVATSLGVSKCGVKKGIGVGFPPLNARGVNTPGESIISKNILHFYRPSEMRLLYFSTVGVFYYFFLSVAFPARPYIRLDLGVDPRSRPQSTCALQVGSGHFTLPSSQICLAQSVLCQVDLKLT